MQASKTSPDTDHPPPENHRQTWTMKEAAHHVGCGLPRLYKRLYERGLFTKLGLDGRHLPTRKLQQEGLFHVETSSFWIAALGEYRPCPKVRATYKGIILLQEIADELAREKAEDANAAQRSRVPDSDHGNQGPRDVLRADADAGDPGHAGHDAGGAATL